MISSRLHVATFLTALLVAFSCAQATPEHGTFADAASQLNSTKPTILLRCEAINKRIWILGAKASDVHVLRGTLPKAAIGRNGEVVYMLKQAVSMEVRGTRVLFSGSDVLLDSRPMGASLNAVVSRDRRVIMDAFIRDFD